MKSFNYYLILGLLPLHFLSYSQTRNQTRFNFGRASLDQKGLLQLRGKQLRNKYKVNLSAYWLNNINKMRIIFNIYMNTPNLKPSLTYKINKPKKIIIISIYAPNPYNFKDTPNIKSWNTYFTQELTNYLKYIRK